MPNITVYIDDKLYEKLLKEDSKSKIIQEALKRYYNLTLS